MNKITLIVVDPQYDFIEGGKLPVKGGTKALDNVVDLINSGKVGQVITTQDWHFGGHESFINFGGDFPEHCVENTHGAKIYDPIMKAIYANNIYYIDYYKGHYSEEFSAFHEVKGDYSDYIDIRASNAKNEECEYVLTFSKDETVVVCGLAGDICVLNTLKALKPLGQLYVYLDGVASLDDGTTLKEYMLENHIYNYGTEFVRH